MHLTFCLMFLLSGISALIFETLWFRLSGITFGNTVWASTIVLASFMGGLAVGNVLAGRYGETIRHPVKLYAAFEFIIAATGLALVLVFPVLSAWTAPLFRPFIDNLEVGSALLVLVAFCLMVIPASAMGATLPLLVKALHAPETPFGYTLGQLYGWNTVGALIGSIIGEAFLIRYFGIRGTGLFAALTNGLAASIALWCSRNGALAVKAHVAPLPPPARPVVISSRVRRLLLAGFCSGGILLALEVLWFRFLLLFFPPHGLIFALMLAVVLAGIASGGIAAAYWLKRRTAAHRAVPLLLLTSGIVITATYRSFGFILTLSHQPDMYPAFVYLMLPASCLSGMIFTFLGASLYDEVKIEIRSTSLLATWNTLGSMVGAALSGFVLIPVIGIEKSFWGLALAYGGTALLTIDWKTAFPLTRRASVVLVGAGVFVLAQLLFPFGLMNHSFLQYARSGFHYTPRHVVAIREGLQETIQYLSEEVLSKPYYFRLLTNSYSMASTRISDRRYMKAFVILPVAVTPAMKRALLISFGVGSTAKALTDTRSLESIDIVDISRDILEMSAIVFPRRSEHPLSDPRVKVHVTDGRYFLQLSDEHFDLITGEPPPPKASGVVNLYTQEYFQLLYDHLTDRGMVTYWLPVKELKAAETKAILKGFCSVFHDCSLWSGAGLQLMMVGTRNAVAPSADEFARQWHDAALTAELQALGLEFPEQLGTLNIADAEKLRQVTADSAPLTDNYPMRLFTDAFLSPSFTAGDRAEYSQWADALSATDYFERSSAIKQLWPEEIRLGTERYIASQRIINSMLEPQAARSPFESLHEVLTTTTLRFPVLMLMQSDGDVQRIIESTKLDGPPPRSMYYDLAARALSERDYARAEELLSGYTYLPGEEIPGVGLDLIFKLRVYLLLLLNQPGKATDVAREFLNAAGAEIAKSDTVYWQWLDRVFRFDPFSSAPGSISSTLHPGSS